MFTKSTAVYINKLFMGLILDCTSVHKQGRECFKRYAPTFLCHTVVYLNKGHSLCNINAFLKLHDQASC